VFVLFKFVSFCLYVCHVFVCVMFVCLCVCIFVCLYLCMFIFLYVCIFICSYIWDFFVLVCLFVCFVMFDCIWCKDSAESFDECVVSFIGDVNIWQIFFSIYKRLSYKGKKMFVFSLVLLLSKFLFSPMIIPNHDLEKTKYKKERKKDWCCSQECMSKRHTWGLEQFYKDRDSI